jgi:UDPglucose 6-dehydrogenase
MEAVDRVNEAQKQVLVRKVRDHFGAALAEKTLAVWGLAFKPRTDDMRDAPSIPLVEGLVESGAEVVAFDPVGREQAEKVLPAIVYAASAEAVADDAAALVVVTEWDEFRALDLDQLAGRMRGKVLVDLRNIYDRADAEKAGLTYRGIGRGRAPSPAA